MLTRGGILGGLKKGAFHITAMETLFTFTDHMVCFSFRTGSLAHNVAGSTRSPIASRNSSKVERVIVNFWIHSSSQASKRLIQCHSHV